MEEYSSGCESGWTVYFEQSACFDASRGFEDGCVNRYEDETEEEDLSMVSDASSGPAHLSQDAAYYMNGSFNNNNSGGFCSVSTDEDAALVKSRERKRHRSKQPRRRDERLKQQQQLDQCHLLDDTASSTPDFNYSMNNNQAPVTMHQMMDFSQQDHFSTSYFQGGASSAAMQNHYNQQVQHQQQQQQYYWY